MLKTPTGRHRIPDAQVTGRWQCRRLVPVSPTLGMRQERAPANTGGRQALLETPQAMPVCCRLPESQPCPGSDASQLPARGRPRSQPVPGSGPAAESEPTAALLRRRRHLRARHGPESWQTPPPRSAPRWRWMWERTGWPSIPCRSGAPVQPARLSPGPRLCPSWEPWARAQGKPRAGAAVGQSPAGTFRHFSELPEETSTPEHEIRDLNRIFPAATADGFAHSRAL